MDRNDAKHLGRLTGAVLRGGTRRVQQAHQGIADRVFSSVGLAVGGAVAPVRIVHDAIAAGVYASVAGSLDLGSRAAGQAVSQVATGRPLVADPRSGPVLGFLNGSHGDVIAQVAPALALPMALRVDGSDVEPDGAALAQAYPGATGRVVVFLHGLVETELSWHLRGARHWPDPETTYGSLLERDLGCTAVWVRYNTGLRISANGATLGALLGRLVAHWPVPVTDLVLVGHSMGGLVVRSALAQAALADRDTGWAPLVHDCVSLGSPHLGAPLERVVNRATHRLRRLGETRWLADALDSRSVGIKDLRHGNLLQDDWVTFQPEDPACHRTHVPLHTGTRHFAVLTTLAPADSFLGRTFGDLLVVPGSALGDSGDDLRLAYDSDAVLQLAGLHHFDLLNHPAVYRAMLRWLTPGGSEGSG